MSPFSRIPTAHDGHRLVLRSCRTDVPLVVVAREQGFRSAATPINPSWAD